MWSWQLIHTLGRNKKQKKSRFFSKEKKYFMIYQKKLLNENSSIHSVPLRHYQDFFNSRPVLSSLEPLGEWIEQHSEIKMLIWVRREDWRYTTMKIRENHIDLERFHFSQHNHLEGWYTVEAKHFGSLNSVWTLTKQNKINHGRISEVWCSLTISNIYLRMGWLLSRGISHYREHLDT